MNVRTMSQFIEEKENPDILFWVGSAGSFDERAKRITRSFVKILNKANVSFAVLGEEESSTGDAAKRSGNEFLFQMQALMNIELLNSYKIKKIVTTCPHAYNTLKNEYGDLGGNYEVWHHTEYISKLINDGDLILKDSLTSDRVTYHDPCYLGRANDIYESPRDIIRKLNLEVIEMKRSKRSSFCCGAGGAQMFKEPERGDKEINIERTEEALKCKPSTIVTACPFCNIMITDGVKLLEEKSVDVLDISELISNNI